LGAGHRPAPARIDDWCVRRGHALDARRLPLRRGRTAGDGEDCQRCREKKGPARRAGPFFDIGGAKRDRTVDLYNAIVALSQLSYGPETFLGGARYNSCSANWQQGLAVALALVVLDFDLDFDVLGLVGQLVRIERLVALDIRHLVAGQRR